MIRDPYGNQPANKFFKGKYKDESLRKTFKVKDLQDAIPDFDPVRDINENGVHFLADFEFRKIARMVEVAKLDNKDSAKNAFYLVSNDNATELATYKIHNPKQQDLHLLVDTWNDRFYPMKAT